MLRRLFLQRYFLYRKCHSNWRLHRHSHFDTCPVPSTTLSTRDRRPSCFVKHPTAPKPHEWTVLNFPRVLVSIRNPVERAISWFLFGRKIFKNQPMERPTQVYKLYHCYSTVEELGNAILTYMDENALLLALPTTTKTLATGDSSKVIVNNSGADESSHCRQLAYRCVQGTQRCPDHNAENYHYPLWILQRRHPRHM